MARAKISAMSCDDCLVIVIEIVGRLDCFLHGEQLEKVHFTF